MNSHKILFKVHDELSSGEAQEPNIMVIDTAEKPSVHPSVTLITSLIRQISINYNILVPR